ncbi:MAG: glycosyltransferase [Bacteroidia bacterium]|nr:glycosyltransferase [Bacteroidia bacterium]
MTTNLAPRKKALFLYNRLAGYFLDCVKQLTQSYPVDVHIVKLPVNQVAPFQFETLPNVTMYNRNELTNKQLMQLCDEINPDFIFCNGWVDKTYLAICRKFKGRVATVLTLDNPWLGTAKQYIGSAIAQLSFRFIFSDVWVPGPPHVIYARKLGFKPQQIFTGKYTANYEWFYNQYKLNYEAKHQNFPKRIIYVGRYTTLKGVEEMWQAFIKLQQTHPNPWELWCLGKGEHEAIFPKHPNIKNFGFVQPANLNTFIAQTGVFILPSKIEHWGVVVHEFAAAGYPIITSNRTNASSVFLKEGINGFTFKSADAESLYQVLLRLISLPDDALLAMGDASVLLAAAITPNTWSDRVWQWIKAYEK